MADKLKNKIDAQDISISGLLKGQKFTIDYFQREYRWQKKHIKLLIEDLTSTFQKSYSSDHKRADVAGYQGYYLGPIVFSVQQSSGKKSIIDGQQRITSLTLLLIYLNHLQMKNEKQVSISELVFSEQYGERSFNMSDESRETCLKSLFEKGSYSPADNDDETVINLAERYGDIDGAFPEELSGEALPYFIDWLIGNVTLVQIIAYSDDNAYTIFETMNDRGLNLTPTEMLKGFVLSKITDKKQRVEINDIWKEEIQKLHEWDQNADQEFFQAWFRGKYAASIRPGKAGSEDQDFELIGSRFHNWFKDNHKAIFKLKTSDEIYAFFKNEFPFFVKCFLWGWEAQHKFDTNIPHGIYMDYMGIAGSLQNPLSLASINFGDTEAIVKKKLDFVFRYIETYTVRRSVNHRKFGQTAIKYTMFNLIKQVRNNDINLLGENFSKEIDSLDEKWEGVDGLVMNGRNRKFIKHLLCRISSYVDELVRKPSDYLSYADPKNIWFEIEHIWADKFDEHRDEFEQENDFQDWRNSAGALLLLPHGTNQSFNSDKYEDKLEHYIKENSFAQTLHPKYYEKNPNFLKSPEIQALGFQAHPQFKKADISLRQSLLRRLCESLWSTRYFRA